MNSSALNAFGLPAIQSKLDFLSQSQWHLVTLLGEAYIPLLLFVIACVFRRIRFALTLGLLGSFTGILVGSLKQTIQEPRPYLVNENVNVYELSVGFGMPSGHSATVLITFFILSAFLCSKGQSQNDLTETALPPTHLKRHWLAQTGLWLCCLLIVLAVGLSRAALGVHTMGQILSGFALAASVFCLFYLLKPALRTFAAKTSLTLQVIISASIAAAFLVHYLFVIREFAKHFVVSQSWLSNAAIQAQTIAQRIPNPDGIPLSPSLNLFNNEYTLLIGLFLGCAIAIILRYHFVAARTERLTLGRTAQCLIGLVVVVYFYATALLTEQFFSSTILTLAILVALPPITTILIPNLISKLFAK